jgi:DNA-binding PadR family transcriptional regulator
MGNSEYAFTDAEIERAVLYRTLRRLQENGYVSSHWCVEEAGPARRVYVLTKAGERHLREWAQVLTKVAVSMDRFVARRRQRLRGLKINFDISRRTGISRQSALDATRGLAKRQMRRGFEIECLQ